MPATELTIEERFSPVWKWGTAALAAAAAILFIIFWSIEDVLWSGIIRLSSFICFAGAVIGGLKLMEGKRSIVLSAENNQLKVSYRKKGDELHQDVFDIHEIEHIYPENISEFDDWSFSNGHGVTPRIRFSDSESDLFLFFYGGRPIIPREGEFEQVHKFLKQHGISTEPIHNDPKQTRSNP